MREERERPSRPKGGSKKQDEAASSHEIPRDCLSFFLCHCLEHLCTPVELLAIFLIHKIKLPGTYSHMQPLDKRHHHIMNIYSECICLSM